MHTIVTSRSYRLATGALFLTAMLWASSAAVPRWAYANGRVVRYERQLAGPYEISFGTIPASPVVGNLHLSVAVATARTGALVQDVDVTVTGTGPDKADAEIGPVTAVQAPTDPSFREVNTVVDRVGIWTFSLNVKAGDGEANAIFEVEVRKASPLPGMLTLVTLLALLTILGFSARAMLTERRAKARQNGRKTKGQTSAPKEGKKNE